MARGSLRMRLIRARLSFIERVFAVCTVHTKGAACACFFEDGSRNVNGSVV